MSLQVVVAELEVGHGGRGGVRLRVFEPGKDPLARGLIGDVAERRRIVCRPYRAPIGHFELVTTHTAFARQQLPAQVQLRGSFHRRQVALPAAGIQVIRGQQRLLPRQGAAVSLADRSRRSLAAVTGHTTELRQGVWNRRMRPERLLLNVAQAGLLQSDVTGGAAVHHALIGQPDLLDAVLHPLLQRDCFGAPANQVLVLVLVVAPLAEVVLGGHDRQRNQEHDADHAESAYADRRRNFRTGPATSVPPPGPHPRPAGAAEERSHRGEHHQFSQKPSHNPERQRLGRQSGRFARAPPAGPLRPCRRRSPASARAPRRRRTQSGNTEKRHNHGG